jgi:uncharacterized protein YdhG (YjbR/CyaY superfamily)
LPIEAQRTVGDYLDSLPTASAAALRIVRGRILAEVPDATERVSYGIPIVSYRGHGLVGYSAATKHCSLHLMSPTLAKELAGTLDDGTVDGATVHFPAGQPLSTETVRLIVVRRIAEADARWGE